MEAREEIRQMVERARSAQAAAEDFSQEQVDLLAAALAYRFSREGTATEIACLAVEETGMGNVPSKRNKLMQKMPAVFHQVIGQRTVGIVEELPAKGIVKLAKPLGVIAALIPSTNPEATPLFKGLLAVRGRNAVIFAPHPRSPKTTGRVVELMRDTLVKNGAPADLFQWIAAPSKEKSRILMESCDITMATGSGDMVRAAYSAGKPAYGVGAGNAVVVVDETADLADAAEKIRTGKTGDNASGCSAENALVIQESVYAAMVDALRARGGHLLTPAEKEQLRSVMWRDGRLSPAIVARDVDRIAAEAGIPLPEGTAFLMVEEDGVGRDHPFSGEKISLVLALYRYAAFGEAVARVNAITAYSGYGHSCGIHSFDEEHIRELALRTKTTKVLVRQPHGVGNSGAWFNGLANTFSLGCGTWGGNIVSENITQKHYLNTTWLSVPIDRTPVPNEEIFQPYRDRIVL